MHLPLIFSLLYGKWEIGRTLGSTYAEHIAASTPVQRAVPPQVEATQAEEAEAAEEDEQRA